MVARRSSPMAGAGPAAKALGILAGTAAVEQAFANRFRNQLVIGLHAKSVASFPGDPIDLTNRDADLLGDLGLPHTLAGEIDYLDLLLRQFRHMQIESASVRNFNVHL